MDSACVRLVSWRLHLGSRSHLVREHAKPITGSSPQLFLCWFHSKSRVLMASAWICRFMWLMLIFCYTRGFGVWVFLNFTLISRAQISGLSWLPAGVILLVMAALLSMHGRSSISFGWLFFFGVNDDNDNCVVLLPPLTPNIGKSCASRTTAAPNSDHAHPILHRYLFRFYWSNQIVILSFSIILPVGTSK